jgi:predicted transcriptional regulator
VARSPRDVTDAELEVLRTLWELGPSPIRPLADRLYPGGGAAHYATVQKLLERLEAKSCVSRKRQGRQFVYRARLSRDELVSRRLRETARQLGDGSLTPLVTHLVNAGELRPEEIAALKRLVEEL